jgi:ABC-2 type transport system ATP-binding protein
MNSTPALTYEQVFHQFGTTTVLNGVSLAAAEGEILGLVGPNGAGKSTLLRCLVGLVRPDAGQVVVRGIDAVQDPLAARRLIGYAPSETALYNRMSAAELLHFAIAFHDSADLDQGLKLLDLLEVPRARRVGNLSHGMKRKIMVAQAIASGAPVLVLDEPMEALDPEARRLVESLLQGAADGGRTVLFSSHNLTSVERLCHRAAFLRRGKIVREGRGEELAAEAGRVLHLQLREPRPAGALPVWTGWHWRGQGKRWTLSYHGPTEKVLPSLQDLPISGIRDDCGSLEEVFDALYGETPS